MAGDVEITSSIHGTSCAGCGAWLRTDDRFCSRCGRAVAAGASLQVPLATPGLAEERRHVTVLFADLKGWTTLAERLDPEVVRAILGSFFAAMAREIQRHGGTVDKHRTRHARPKSRPLHADSMLWSGALARAAEQIGVTVLLRPPEVIG